MARKVSSLQDMDPEDVAVIQKHAARLNANSDSPRSYDKIRRFAKRERGVWINNHNLKLLLQDPAKSPGRRERRIFRLPYAIVGAT